MCALSIRQPWAWLICAGLKDIENRSRRVHHRGSLLIHASRQLADMSAREIEKSFRVEIPDGALMFGGIVGVVDVVDCVTSHPSPWFERGRLGLVLANPRPLPFVPFPGQLGLFEFPDELIALAPN